MGRWFSVPWYPILFSAYPVLALMAINAGQIKLEAGWRPLVICILLSSVLFAILRRLLRDWNRAAFLSVLWMALFFSYGHIHILLAEKLKDFDFKPLVQSAWLLLFILAVLWARRSSPSPAALNVIALGLAVISLVQINSGLGKGGAHSLGAKNAPVQALVKPENSPDVYYFILDMYTRADLLKRSYGYDNNGFIGELQRRGFYVASCSQSNYSRTELSLASSLNMSFIQGLDPQFDDPKSTRRSRLWDSLKHSAVRYNLEQMGYRTISYANGYAWSELDDADVFLTPPPFSSGMTEFETLFMQTTLARVLQDLGWLDLDQIIGQNYRDRHTLVFDSLDDVANIPDPKFVYVHLILPHPPFVYGPDGVPTDPRDFWNEQKRYPPDKFKVGYTNQTTFLNRKMLEAVDTIIAESKNPPVIILQGDHGHWLQHSPQHFFILNAYYLPGHAGELYPTISPVNTFRLIFNAYFGGKYDMLADVTYFSPVPKLYEFSMVPNRCQ